MREHLSVRFYKHTISDDHVVYVRMCINAHIIIIQLELHYCATNPLYEEPLNNWVGFQTSISTGWSLHEKSPEHYNEWGFKQTINDGHFVNHIMGLMRCIIMPWNHCLYDEPLNNWVGFQTSYQYWLVILFYEKAQNTEWLFKQTISDGRTMCLSRHHEWKRRGVWG